MTVKIILGGGGGDPPVPAGNESLFGYMSGTITTVGDVMAPLDIEWSALSDDEDHLYKGKKRRAKQTRKK